MLNINGEDHLMQIVAFDADDKTSGGKAKISWLMKDLLSTTRAMNSTNTNEGGWPATEMRTWLRDSILPTIDSNIRSHIVDVNKTYYNYTDKTTKTASDNIWLPSYREMKGASNSYETSGTDYTAIFNSNQTRIKKCSGKASRWWLRSSSSDGNLWICCVQDDGSLHYVGASISSGGICIGFCTD